METGKILNGKNISALLQIPGLTVQWLLQKFFRTG